MWWFVRTWWLLRILDKECRELTNKYSVENVLREYTTLSRTDFIDRLAKRSINRLPTLLWWQKKSEKVLKKRIREYNLIIGFCAGREPKYIGVDSNNNDFIYIAPDGATFIKISNAIVEFANQYKIIWVIVIALIAYSPKFTIWLYRVTDFVKDILH